MEIWAASVFGVVARELWEESRYFALVEWGVLERFRPSYGDRQGRGFFRQTKARDQPTKNRMDRPPEILARKEPDMSCERRCGMQRQPCPSPWRCSPTFCHFQDGENERARDKAARHFWEPNQALHIDVYTGPSWFVRALDWVGNQWDKLNVLSQVCAVVAGVAICFAVAVAAVG